MRKAVLLAFLAVVLSACSESLEFADWTIPVSPRTNAPSKPKVSPPRAPLPGIWTSLTFHHRSIFWPINRVFRIRLVISWRPERTARLTAFPRAAMLILIVGRAHAEAFVLHLAPPTPSKRKKRPITTNPLITTQRFDQRRFGIATERTMIA